MTEDHVEDDDEWEYEYDNVETETFLVDLDLSTINHDIKPSSTVRGKKTLDLPEATNESASKKKPRSLKRRRPNTNNGQPQEEGPDDAGDAAEAAMTQDEDASGEYDDENVQTNILQAAKKNEEGVQILDLHTANPFVCYQGSIYSCTWHDLIGTNMFFSPPQDMPLIDPEMVTPNFDLIGTSRIKLVGNEAKVKLRKIGQKRRREHGEPDAVAGKSLGNIRTTNAKRNIDLRRQANFLDQLMDIKRARGETDNVHVLFNERASATEPVSQTRELTEERRQHVDKLNRRIVQGDADAWLELKAHLQRTQGAAETEAEAGNDAAGPE